MLAEFLIIGAALYLKSNQLRKKREYEYERFNRERVHYERQLAHRQKNQEDYLHYKHHIALHHAATQTANQMYQLYQQDKKHQQDVYQHLRTIGQEIAKLKTKRETAKGTEKQNIRMLLQQARDLHTQLKAELEVLKQATQNSLQQVRELNEKTHEHKEYIRLNTGRFGQQWYNRLQQRHK